jgi:hypothetical protein
MRGRIIVWFIKHIIPWSIALGIALVLANNNPNLIELGGGIPLTIGFAVAGFALSYAQDALFT